MKIKKLKFFPHLKNNWQVSLLWILSIFIFSFSLGFSSPAEVQSRAGFLLKIVSFFPLIAFFSGIVFFLLLSFKTLKKEKFFSAIMYIGSYFAFGTLLAIFSLVVAAQSKDKLFPAEGNHITHKTRVNHVPSSASNSAILSAETQSNIRESAGKINNYSQTINQIICVGPDGKEFLTTKEECKKLNNAWGKPMDMVVDCRIHPNCGGGTRRMRKSECDRSTCCEIDGKWYFYPSKEKCTEDRKKYWSDYYDKYNSITNNYGNDFDYPTLAPLSTVKPPPTIKPPPDLSNFYSKLNDINKEVEESMSEYTRKIEESSRLDVSKTHCYWKHHTLDKPEWVCESF